MVVTPGVTCLQKWGPVTSHEYAEAWHLPPGELAAHHRDGHEQDGRGGDKAQTFPKRAQNLGFAIPLCPVLLLRPLGHIILQTLVV